MSVPRVRARSSGSALAPGDGRGGDRPRRRAGVGGLEVDVSGPTDFNTNHKNFFCALVPNKFIETFIVILHLTMQTLCEQFRKLTILVVHAGL
jgi:hypothetical protein